ncbi:hypothetical protein JX266_001044 [Neoarthrinium moseri]|nr:hypothetical protein JX266_001044 [Neoarthrinium moseri]
MATDTLANQVPINNTIQVNVRPGNETGLYYILLSNLPWQTSWQHLKDHVRTVCSAVERVEIFNESTTAWVCVRGHENYKAALHLLSTVPFNGRPTFADGRNAHQEIPIKRLVGPTDMRMPSPRSPRTPRTTPQVTQYSSHSPSMMSPTVSDYSQWPSAAPGSIMSSPATEYGVHPLPMAAAYDYSESNGSYPAYENGYVDATTIMPTAARPYTWESNYPYSQHYAQSSDYYDSNNYAQSSNYYDNYSTSTYTAGPGAKATRHRRAHSGELVATERRKILIKNLTSWTQRERVMELLQSKCGINSNQISAINVPSSNGSSRGYATVTFNSEEKAAKAVKKLHKYKVDGKTLEVDYTKEGVSRNEDTRGRHYSKHQREEKEKNDNAQSSGSSSDKKERPAKKGVIIANGSSKKVGESSKGSN